MLRHRLSRAVSVAIALCAALCAGGADGVVPERGRPVRPALGDADEPSALRQSAPPVADEPSALRHLRFTEDTGVFRNPGQGWSAEKWALAKSDEIVNVGAMYGRFDWAALEPEEGVYDWTRIEETIELGVSKGIPSTFRVLCASSYTKTGWATPKWVFDKGAKDDPFVNTMEIKGEMVDVVQHTPIFDDPVFMEAHRKFLAALAARYDGDPRIAGFDIGSYGHWGEWHCFGLPPDTNRYSKATQKGPPVPPRVYPPEIRRQYADWYLDSFRKTPLVFMTDDWETFKFALGEDAIPRVGIRRDGVGSPHHYTRWIGKPPYDAIPHMADVWRHKPVWFEFFTGVPVMKRKGWDLGYSVDWMLTNHVSLIRCSPWDLGNDPEDFDILRKIDLYAGARLVPREADVWRKGRRIAVRLVGENIGVARIYLPYALQFVVADAGGRELLVHESSVDPGAWLPGPFAVVERFLLPDGVDATDVRLSVRLRHRPGVLRNFRFAALESATDGSLPLGTFTP